MLQPGACSRDLVLVHLWSCHLPGVWGCFLWALCAVAAWKPWWRITKVHSVVNYISWVLTVQLWEKKYFFALSIHGFTLKIKESLHDSPFPCLMDFLNTFSVSTVQKVKGTSQIIWSQVSFLQLHLLLMANLQLFLIHLHIFVFEILPCPTFCCLSPSLSLTTFPSWFFIYLILPCWAIFLSSENRKTQKTLQEIFL